MIEAPRGPSGFVVYCDDVRQEVGGKLSYMGVYNSSLYPSQPFPAVLSKLFAVVNYSEPEEVEAAPIVLEITLEYDDGRSVQLISADVPMNELSFNFDNNSSNAQLSRLISAPAAFERLPIDAPGRMRVSIIREGRRYRLNSLAIRHRPDASSSNESADVVS